MIDLSQELNYKKRNQYKIDAKVLMCRGIDEKDAHTLKAGLRNEKIGKYLSMAYVPLAFIFQYK
jgi:hypothetical protein